MSSQHLGSPPPPYTFQSTTSLTVPTRYLPNAAARPRYCFMMFELLDPPRERGLPTLTFEIFDRILSHADTATLRTCSLLSSDTSSMAQTYLVESVTIDYDSDYQRTHDTTTKLLALFSRCPDLSRYVRHLVIKDTPASFAGQYSECLLHMDEDERNEYEQIVRRHNALCPGLMYYDDALAGILELTTHLVTVEIDLRDYHLDWRNYENWHYAKNVTSVLGLETLKAITLRGILGIPLPVLEKARNLKSLSISRSSVCYNNVLPIAPSTPQTCLELLRTKDIIGGKELARYFGARNAVISIRGLKKIYVEVVREEDMEIARAVFESATELEDLQMSTMFYFQKSMSIINRRFYFRTN